VRSRARNGPIRPGRADCAVGAVNRGAEMSLTIGRDKRFPPRKSLFPPHGYSTTLTTTEIGSEAALRSCAARANARGLEFPLSRGKSTQQPARVRTNDDEVNTMHVLVDLKVCESCGSLWYRAAGQHQVYCGSCAVKLGEFPPPRLRRRPGGRRKHAVSSGELFQVPSRGGR